MLDRFADWLDQQAPERRRLYSVFIALALLTIPCYASATLLWFFNTPGAGTGSTSSEQATAQTDSEFEATLAIPTIADEATEPATLAPRPPTERPRKDKDPEPTLAPRPSAPPLPSPTFIIVPTPVLRASPTLGSSATPQPPIEPTEIPTALPTETDVIPEPTDVPTEVPALPSPTPPIQVTLDP